MRGKHDTGTENCPDQRAYKKSKSSEGLTEAEKSEQALLRKEYIDNVRQNLRNQLNNINVQNEDGSIENLGERYGSKNA